MIPARIPSATDPASLHRAILVDVPGADPVDDRVVRHTATGTTTIVPVPSVDDVVPAALALVDDGARVFELCGGISPVWRNRTHAAVAGRAIVSSVTFGIESLLPAARYNDAWSAGATTTQAFLLLEPDATPDADHSVLTPEHLPIRLVPVPDARGAATAADELATAGVGLIELYGGFDDAAVDAIITAVDGRSAVGVGSVLIETHPRSSSRGRG